MTRWLGGLGWFILAALAIAGGIAYVVFDDLPWLLFAAPGAIFVGLALARPGQKGFDIDDTHWRP